ncbi:hypothetical protein Mtc_0308 [Methanocella conradii HZ254]|uniref:Uncharacterized protein n=1 Tax=Methanocella conradii (strain DSM 24694 / JCM 17849 / CGMCC 1.5162 / HZ254) TaxID=1041930 RepID=H8I976_METCZ|nr:hypothetical protein [Methanocella conradii]AFC99079.1 hypothetical protein Mtc_0308 [Methanocella conradii HZ254]
MELLKVGWLKYALSGAAGFGVGGAIWGYLIFSSFIYYLTSPFDYFYGAIALGVIGGVALALFSKDLKRILLFPLLGVISFVIGFVIVSIFSYPIMLFSPLYLPLYIFGEKAGLFMLKPELYVGPLALGFAFMGDLAGLAYGLAYGLTSRKSIPYAFLYVFLFMLAGMIGFGIGSLVSPVIGNLVGMAFDSLLAAYLVTFTIVGAIPGALLGMIMYLADKSPSKP